MKTITKEEAELIQREINSLSGEWIPIEDILFICSDEWKQYKKQHKIEDMHPFESFFTEHTTKS